MFLFLDSTDAPLVQAFTNAQVWTWTHNLGYKPDVAVLVDGKAVAAEVEHVSNNQLQVTWLAPKTGELRITK